MATKKKSTNTAKNASTKKTGAKEPAGKPAKPAKKKAAAKTEKKVSPKATGIKKAAAGKKAAKSGNKKSTPKKSNVKKSMTEKKAAQTKANASAKKAASTQVKTETKPNKPSQKKKVAKPTNGVTAESAKTKAPAGSNKKSSAKPEKPRFVYKPEPSILDTPKEQPRKRYSDNELKEFKVLIQGKLEAARKELAYLQGLITRKDEAGTDDTENKYMGVEDGSGTMEREQLSQLASRQIQFIDKLEKALQRIENKTYGICRETGKLIDKARLRAVPHATLSIEAKLAKRR